MRDRLLANSFIEKEGVFVREFRGSYVKPYKGESNKVFDVVEDVIVARAFIYQRDNDWILDLHKLNPIKCNFDGCGEICVSKVEKYGDFFELLLRGIYIDVNNEAIR